MIAILDYDMGNVGSIQNMIKKIGGYDTAITRDEAIIGNSECLILPGVGSYDKGMESLEKYGLIPSIIAHVDKGRPILGICLGMQLFGKRSEEGKKKGLGFLDFECKRFSFESADRKVPHMGWDYAKIVNADDPVCQGMDSVQRYYFIHSYYAVCSNSSEVMMTCSYGVNFAAAVSNGQVYGMQFHPEKSHRYGKLLLTNFLREKCGNVEET